MTNLELYLALTIGLMGSTDFKQREKATAYIRYHLDDYYPMLLMAEKHRDPEIATRSRMLVNDWTNKNIDKLTDQWKPLHWKNWPWIQAITVDQCPLVDTYVEQAEESEPGARSRWTYYSAATRLWVKNMILSRTPPEAIGAIIIELSKRHQESCRTIGKRVPSDPVFSWNIR